MFTSAELIEALRRRTRRSLRPPPPPGEFPAGWREWFQAMAARPGAVAGAAAGDIVAVMAARGPVVSPGLVEELGRWRAFTTLWRQDWQPASRDERWMRIVSMSASLLLHLLFVVTLAWLMFSRFHFPGAPEAARDGEEVVLQVEYIGEGTPADAGGGAPDAPSEHPGDPAPGAEPLARAASAEPAPAPAPTPAPAPGVVPAPPDAPAEAAAAQPPPVPVRTLALDVPQLAPPTVGVQQALQVTEVEVADSRFAVPPPRELVAVDAPDAPAPEVSTRRRDIDLEATARVQVSPQRVALPRPAALPDPATGDLAVAERSVELEEAGQVTVAQPRDLAPIGSREVSADAPAARVREVPMPAARPAPSTDADGAAVERSAAAAAGPAVDAAPGTADRGTARSASSPGRAGVAGAATPATTTPGGRIEAGGGARGSTPAAGAGRRPGLPPGTLPSAAASDDWGDSTRNVPGRQAGTPGGQGLFNADGSPRLADGGRVGGGLPPGTITETFENIDRHGTWLKRPPYDYEPTSFDRFWLPSETLLEEWVRKSVTEVRIPIPGTTKTIRCVTILLAVGGACDIIDPNLQEEPAGARRPPDVPFKRELQEDQDSLGPAPER